MKVLFVGNHRELSGWSYQGLNHILALDKVGVNIIPKNINLTGITNPDVSPRIAELERGDSSNPDIVILNTLPNNYERQGPAKYVGYYVVETTSFQDSGWVPYINLMDQVVVPCYHNKEASLRSGIKVPINIIHTPVDLDKFSRNYPIHMIREHFKEEYIFYVVSELTKRKNIESIIAAFHLEFHPSEPVQLLIKTVPTTSPAKINELIDNVKNSLKLYRDVSKYKKENIISDFGSEESICSLHLAGDCYVSASRGEAWNLPAVDAIGFNSSVVAPRWGGFLEYLTDKNSYLVDGVEQPCQGHDGLPDLYTGRESFYEVSIHSLRSAMRSAYTKKDLSLRKKQQARKDIEKLSLDNVGRQYKAILEKLC